MFLKSYFKLLTVSLIALTLLGCKRQLSYKELTSDLPAAKCERTWTSTQMNYNLSLPKQFKRVEKEYNDTIGYELYIDTTSAFEKGTSIISVLKYLSEEKTSKAFYQKNLSNKLQNMNRMFHSKGETTLLNYPAYYAHYSTEISKQPRESIVFIVPGNASDFYMIVIDTGADDNYTDNMKQLLSNVKTFKIKS
ncbi:MAG: hypothetical protein RLZ33_1837 [Bacteroidota bacterium]|jgi:hypothetical protein